MDKHKLSILSIDTFSDSKLLGGAINPQENKIQTIIQKLGTFILVQDNTEKNGKQKITEINCQPRIFSPRGTGYAEKATISFKLSTASNISIKIYNLAGRLVRIVADRKFMSANYCAIDWDGRDYNGEICPSDLYIVTIESSEEVKTITVMILDKS